MAQSDKNDSQEDRKAQETQAADRRPTSDQNARGGEKHREANAKDRNKQTRSDVAGSPNEDVDATRVHVANSDNENGEELNSDNAAELMTENPVAERNRKVGDIGTRHEDPEVAKNFNL